MSTFTLREFTLCLLVDSIFKEEHFTSMISLIDTRLEKEMYLMINPLYENKFLIEKAIEWEEEPVLEEEEHIFYCMAIETEDFGMYDTKKEVAEALLSIAEKENLLPRMIVLPILDLEFDI